jgi:hypothetical protein
MAELSPAAQAVLDAAWEEMKYASMPSLRKGAAAALRAAADQVVPDEPEPKQSAMPFSDWNLKVERWDARLLIRRELLALAAELKSL